MEKWEYKTFLVSRLDDVELNHMGDVGWEAVSLVPNFSHHVFDSGPLTSMPILPSSGRTSVGTVTDSYLVLFKRRKQ
jgi:hypothetical protein